VRLLRTDCIWAGAQERPKQRWAEKSRLHVATLARCHSSVSRIGSRRKRTGDCPPGAAHGSAFRSQNKVLRLLRFCPLRPNLYRSGPDVRPEPRHKPCSARPMPRPRTQRVIGTQKPHAGKHLTWTEAVQQANGNPSYKENVRCPGGAFRIRQCPAMEPEKDTTRTAYPQQTRAGQDGQVMELVRNDSYYYYTIREGVKSRGNPRFRNARLNGKVQLDICQV
jgi:hypothetical protein